MTKSHWLSAVAGFAAAVWVNAIFNLNTPEQKIDDNVVVATNASEDVVTTDPVSGQTQLINSEAELEVQTEAQSIASDSGDKDEQIAALQKRINILEGELDFFRQVQAERAKAKQAMDKYESVKAETEAATPEKWQDEEIEEAYAEPFTDYVKNTQGKFREDLKQFQHQPVDDEFAGRFETLMRDFVIQHQYYGDIEQWDVTCKSYQCEMRVVSVEVDNKSWQRIFNDMKLESWFQFTGYTTAPIPNEEYKTIGAILFLQGIPNV